MGRVSATYESRGSYVSYICITTSSAGESGTSHLLRCVERTPQRERLDKLMPTGTEMILGVDSTKSGRRVDFFVGIPLEICSAVGTLRLKTPNIRSVVLGEARRRDK